MQDFEAVRRCRAGDVEAFRVLVERYERQALAHARALCGELESGRDAVQEAFLDAFRALERFDPSRPFYPWFHVLLRNRCFKRKPRLVCVSALLEAREESRELDEALRALEPDAREILWMKYFDRRSYREIAELLGIPVGTVMSRLFNARRALRKELE